jgi:hypothetical protein
MKHLLIVVLIVAIALPMLPARAQDEVECPDAPPSHLMGERYASITEGHAGTVYENPDTRQIVGEITRDEGFIVLSGPPVCVDNSLWWRVTVGDFFNNYIPETVNGVVILEPFVFVPEPPVALGVPMTDPVMTSLDFGLPPVSVTASPQNLPYANWNWAAYTESTWLQAPDPLSLQMPAAYAGDHPVPPVNLDEVLFVERANLNSQQLALLAQNGFVVVPGGVAQFDDVYLDDTWPHREGLGDFITTDAFLHALFLTYQNSLMFLETGAFYGRVTNFVGGGYQAAEAQYIQAQGTSLEDPTRSAAVYYAVALMLLGDGEAYHVGGFEQTSAFREGDIIPSQVLATANPEILDMARPLADMARAAEGRLPIPFLDDYEEDFSQYRPRSYYAGNPLLEAYFRGMMWLGRVTFRARSDEDTLAGLLVMRALDYAPGAPQAWASVAETLDFMVGPMDDFNPSDYRPLAHQIYGIDMPLDALSDDANLQAFLAEVAQLPGPRVNSIVLPIGVEADEVDALTRGFRLFGQRFTLDGYIMQQLIYPEVGTQDMSRALPLGLDVAASLGSDMAYLLADDAGATAFQNYNENVVALREEIAAMDGSAWLENLYGGWLWALQPLLVINPDVRPPMMLTDAWQRKDIHTTLGSWTELKHATLLYTEQPMGGLGGGGFEPPVTSTSYVEPNPQVFARIAVVAATLDEGLAQRGFYEDTDYNALHSMHDSLQSLATLSAKMAEVARMEVAGEPVPYEELYWMQEHFGSTLWNIRYLVEIWITNPPENVALVADVSSNPAAGLALEEAIGMVDYIYVIANGPDGYHLTRGAVYSYYEFTQPIDQRMTDDEWRTQVAAGSLPPRPEWVGLYFSE